MPPKRKRTDADVQPAVSTSKSTRSSTRSGAAAESATRNSAASKSKAKAPTKFAGNDTPEKNSKVSKAQRKLEEPAESASELEEKPEPPRKKGKKTAFPTPVRKKAPPAAKFSLYSRSLMERLFAVYADDEDVSLMGAEGLERLCKDSKIPMEGAQLLLLAWLLDASDLGKFKIAEWVRGLDALQIDTLEKLSIALSEYESLLISDIPVSKLHSTNKKHALEPYNRDLNYWIYAADASKAFQNFYAFVFLLAKAPQERNIDIEIAKAFWTALLSPKYPVVNDLIEFIDEKGTVKGVNKDVWGMTLDFCETFNVSLEGYEPDGAWPTLLDEFYAWKKAKQPSDTVDGDNGIDR